MKEKKMNFFKQFGIAVARPDLYGKLAQVGTGRMILFILLFSFLYMFVWISSMYGIIRYRDGGIDQIVKEALPEFYLEGGNLQLEEKFVDEANGTFICVDTDVEQFGFNDLQYVLNTKLYNQVCLVSKTNMILMNKQGKLSTLKFSDLQLQGRYSKDELIDLGMDYLQKILWIIAAVAFPFTALAIFIMGFVFSLIIAIIAAIFGKSLKGGQIYRMGVYSCVMLMMVGLVLETFLGGIVPDILCRIIYIILFFAYSVIGVLSADAYKTGQSQPFTQAAGGDYAGGAYYNTTYTMNNDVNDAFSNHPITPETQAFQGNMGTEGNRYGANGGNTYGVNGNSYGAGGSNTYGVNGNSYGANGSNTYGVNGNSYGANGSNTYGVNGNSYGAGGSYTYGAGGTESSYQPEIPSFGMNIIGQDGKIQDTSTENSTIGTNVVKNQEEKEEGVISNHKGLETNVISFDGSGPMQAYPPVVEKIEINGVSCLKSDLDLIDKYLVVGLRESAVDMLCQLTDCTKEKAEEILMDWNQYYHG